MNQPGGSFIWYELMTPNANAAARFYGAVVGWTIAHEPQRMPGGKDYRMIGRSDGGHLGGVLALSPDMLAHGARATWLGYLHVADVDGAVAAITGDGGKLLMPKITLPVGDIAMVADPLGAPLYVMTPVPPPDKPNAISDVFSVDRPEHVRWNELHSADPARAKAFYARHFNFAFHESMPLGPEMGNYDFIDHGGLRLGAVMKVMQPSMPSAWNFYFGVRSVLAAKQAVEANGGTVTMGPHQVPGGDWIITATDPQGAAFGVVGPKGE